MTACDTCKGWAGLASLLGIFIIKITASMQNYNKQSAMHLFASYLLVALFLLVVLVKGLLSALFAGLLVHSLIHLMSPLLGKRISGERARLIAVALLSALVVGLLSIAIGEAVSFFMSDAGSIQNLLQKLADIIEASRNQFPSWLKDRIPGNADGLREMMTGWLREHAVEAKMIGTEAGRTVAHLLIGMIIGAMIALHDTSSRPPYRALAAALRDRIVILSDAFQRIVFAQVRIAAINTVITAIFLYVVLPLAGVSLPLLKSLVAITFFAGLLPVVGNLISNTVLVIVGLSHSLHTAVASLLFLMVVHKLEYFLNARIIGSHINAFAWELLVAMLVMESIFGLPGVVAAPVFYAYVKKELTDKALV
jgi:predicted PurR-regulated permease PerM